MNFALQLGLILLTMAVLYLFRPKVTGPASATVGEFDVPKTKEGEEIGRAYGTNWFKSAQIPWNGDFNSEEIKSSAGKK